MASRFVVPNVPEAIEAIELVRVRVPLVEPFVASHGVEHERDLTLVHTVGADGVEGWGECDALTAATYVDEDAASAWRFLAEEVGAAHLFDRRPLDIAGHAMAWAAMETALLDLHLRREGTSLATHVGASRPAVACGAVVGRQDSIDDLLAVVARRLADHAAFVKLKIGPGWDLEPLRAVRHAFPGSVLCADANGAYPTGDHPTLAAIDGLGLAYVEQPLAPTAVADLNDLVGRIETRVALDESILTSDDLDRFARGRLVVNVKPARLGGIAEAVRTIERAGELGMATFVGGMLEAGIGRAAALALAAIDALTEPTDLGPSSRYVADDLTEPFELDEQGRLPVPRGPGIGVTPRPERIEACTVDRVVLRP